MSRRTRIVLVATACLLIVPIAAFASDRFTDVPDSNVFHDDITWLADAGVTLGCNPPANDEFCPKDNVTREQMAAFMRRLAENQVVDAATAIEAEHAATADDATTLDGIDSNGFTGDNIVDGSLRLADLGSDIGVQTTTVNTPITLAAGECKAELTGNFGEGIIGSMVVGTLADPNGDPVLPNAAAFVPSVVIGTTQGGAVPNLVVCNTGNAGSHTIPAGSVFTWRLIDP